jgi:hypothetical protein
MIKRVKSLISEKWRVVEPWSGQVKILTKLEKLSMGPITLFLGAKTAFFGKGTKSMGPQ